jgi:hypothetical protein
MVNLREELGQLHISWNVPTSSTLTILDGTDKTSILITPEHSTVTYARRSGDVTVKLGSALARFIGPLPPPPEIVQLRTSVHSLQSKIASLRKVQSADWAKLSALQEYF